VYKIFVTRAPEDQCIITFLSLALCIVSYYLARGRREWSLQVAVT